VWRTTRRPCQDSKTITTKVTSAVHAMGFATLARILGVVLPCVPAASAWQGTFPRIDLSWPAIQVQRDEVAGGQILDQAVTNFQPFPCAYIPVPTSVARTEMPIESAVLQLALSAPDPADRQLHDKEHWVVDLYFGQFFDNSSIGNTAANWIGADVFSWNATGFTPGTWCNSNVANMEPFNISAAVERAGGFGRPMPGGNNLEGVNATLGLRLIRFGGALGGDNEDEMIQVGARMCDPVSDVLNRVSSKHRRFSLTWPLRIHSARTFA
jgi:hypothetical protein